MERCSREIVAIEVELLAGNPDVTGLLLGYADWHAELRILQAEEQCRRGSDRTEMRVHRRIEKLEQVLKVKVFPTHVITISFVGAGGRVTGTMVSSNDPALCVPYRIEDGERKHREG
jgi:hypothetical protein